MFTSLGDNVTFFAETLRVAEATTFALLCSIVNFGTFCSNLVGGTLFNALGYNGLVLISGLTTLACLGFIPYLQLQGVKDEH